MKKQTIILLGLMLLTISCGGQGGGQNNNQQNTLQNNTQNSTVNNSNSNNGLQNNNIANSPDQMFNALMNAIQAGDTSKIFPEGTSQNVIMLSEGYKKITYNINNTQVNGNIAIINVSMKYPNIQQIVQNFRQELSNMNINSSGKSEEEVQKIVTSAMMQYVAEKLNAGNVQYMEKTINVKYEKNGGSWVMSDDNAEFATILSLGL
jgi:hypothetical protein